MLMDVRHENSYFMTHVIVAEDHRLFISVDPSDPQRLSVLGTGARLLLALSESTTVEEAEMLSSLISEFGRQLIIEIDNSHPLFLSATVTPLARH